MAAAIARPMRLDAQQDRKQKQSRNDIWTSLLKQTRIAQSRNRTNAIAHRQLIVCGGSPEEQRNYLNSLARPPAHSLRRTRNEKSDHEEKGTLAVSNRYAYGFGHLALYSAQQGGIGIAGLGTESEEVARIECHCVPEPDITYEPILRRILTQPLEQSTEELDEEVAEEETHKPAVQILLSWKEPWKFLKQLRAWLQLLARAVLPASSPVRDEDPVEVLKEFGISITVVAQHIEAQQELEREGWTEETFDYVCQVLRTVLLPLHPFSALLYVPSLATVSHPAAQLTETQKVVYTALKLDLGNFSPRPTSSSGSTLTRKEDLLPRHNVVDRMNIVIPGGWDSAGKVRLLSETFSPEDVLSAWGVDLNSSVFPYAALQQAQVAEVAAIAPTEGQTGRQEEEMFSAEPSSPISSEPSLPPSPSKRAPSAIRAYEAQIVDPNAHKVVKAPTITVINTPEQDFLKEMKTELDRAVAEDRSRSSTANAATTGLSRTIGMPTGESTGALDSLGDVSFNVGGVSYNAISAEAAIERLRRPHAPGIDGSSPTSSSRTGTPRPPRRLESDREGTPGVSTPASGRADFPSEDLEKYFASLAKKAGGGESRQGTPSRQ